MKKTFYIFALLYIGFHGYSQDYSLGTNFIKDAGGNIVAPNAYMEINGNLYFPETWVKGAVQMKAGKIVRFDAIRFNTVNQLLEFKVEDIIYNLPYVINEFTLDSMVFRNGLPNVDNQDAYSFYQILYDGKQKIVCYRHGVLMNQDTYNSATKTKKVDSIQQYYLLKEDGKMYSLKKNPKNLLPLISDKASEINAFCEREHINLKKWKDAVKVLAYTENLKIK
jgi:hypothetical protein